MGTQYQNNYLNATMYENSWKEHLDMTDELKEEIYKNSET